MTLVNIVTAQTVTPGVLGFPAARATVLTGMTRAQLQAALASAQAALVAWVPGGKVVTASYGQGDGTKSVTYNMTSMGQLQGWIMLLQQALGIGGRRRPLVPIYL
jgi:hypothetical protein